MYSVNYKTFIPWEDPCLLTKAGLQPGTVRWRICKGNSKTEHQGLEPEGPSFEFQTCQQHSSCPWPWQTSTVPKAHIAGGPADLPLLLVVTGKHGIWRSEVTKEHMPCDFTSMRHLGLPSSETKSRMVIVRARRREEVGVPAQSIVSDLQDESIGDAWPTGCHWAVTLQWSGLCSRQHIPPNSRASTTSSPQMTVPRERTCVEAIKWDQKGGALIPFNLHLYEERNRCWSTLSCMQSKGQERISRRGNSQRSLQKPARKKPFPEANRANILIPKA